MKPLSLRIRMKPIFKLLFLSPVLMFLLAGCRRSTRHIAYPAFYSWKTVYQPGAAEIKAFSSLQCVKMYIRCFDVGYDAANSAAFPQAIVRLPQKMDTGIGYVPVVFITQQAIAMIALNKVPLLAVRISTLLESRCRNSILSPKEIQIDCDWTAASRETYFRLLSALKQQDFFKGKILSCTIRLHQLKYKLQSGTPPADRGMLMCYNVGDLKQPAAHNSILDVPLAKDYLKHMDSYPLRLDIALPLFHWCVLFRKGLFGGIIRDADPAELKEPLFTLSGRNIYTVQQDSMWHGYSLLRGDVIRAEGASAADLQEIASFTAAHLNTDTFTLAFFHLDTVALNHYSTYEIQKILGAYH